MSRLRIIISPQYDPFLNRAVEQYLTECQEEGVVTMYLWKNERTVVIGYNQNPYAECNVKLLLEEGGHLMRRGTGGGAVYHDLGNINFSFIADKRLYDVRKQLSVIQDARSTHTVCRPKYLAATTSPARAANSVATPSPKGNRTTCTTAPSSSRLTVP